MPATSARIGFIMEEFRTATAGPDAEVVARYGALARDTKEPIQTYFDDVDDALAMASERLDFLSPDRRRFQCQIQDLPAVMGLEYNVATPSVAFVDTERDVAMDAAVVDIRIDFEAERAVLTVWG